MKQKNKYLLIFLILSFFKIQAQSITVTDSISRQKLPYATVLYKGGGLYSDNNGQFSLNGIPAHKIKITYLGYEDFILHPSTYKNLTVRMVPKSIELPEVILQTITKKVKIDFLKNTRDIGYFPLMNGHEIFMRIVPNKTNANSIIEAVYFSFEKNSIREKSPSGQKIRINIYNELDEKIYSEIKEIDAGRQKIKLILPENKIQFHENGIGFGIELLDSVGNDENDPISLNLRLTGETTKEYSAETFYKYIFDNQENLVSLDQLILDNLGENYNRKKNYSRNVNIALDLIRNKEIEK